MYLRALAALAFVGSINSCLLYTTGNNDIDMVDPAELEAMLAQEQMLKEQGIQQESTATKVPDSILVNILVNEVGIVPLLQKQLYSRSNTPPTRNLNDLPTFNTVCTENNCFTINIFPFYNQTSQVLFTKDSPFLNSYVHLGSNNFIEELIKIIQRYRPELGELKPQEILPLFAAAKLQERKTGLYFRTCATYNDFTLQISLPLYYLERNFFLTQKEINRIKLSPFIAQLSAGPSDDEVKELLTRHLVGDKFGLGDMRIHALYTPYRSENCRLTGGGIFTFPTANAFKEGLVGGAFCKKTAIPQFSLSTAARTVLENLGVDEEQIIKVTRQFTDLSFAILDRLTANVAEISLGNESHFAFGPFIESEYNYNDTYGILSQFSAQYLVEGKEPRYFIRKIIPAEFNRDFDSTDETVAAANLAFLDRKALELAFPAVKDVNVKPGAIIDFNIAATYTLPYLKAALGYDFWWQGKEKIEFLHQPKEQFLVHKALNDSAYQHKIFGRIDAFLPGCEEIFAIGLRGDVTFASQTVGKDFTLALNFQWNY